MGDKAYGYEPVSPRYLRRRGITHVIPQRSGPGAGEALAAAKVRGECIEQ